MMGAHNHREWRRTLVLLIFMTGFFSVPMLVQAIKTVAIEVEEEASTRAEALRQALDYAISKALYRHVDEESYNDNLLAFFKQKIDDSQKRKYRPLVDKWRLKLDVGDGKVHVLKGNVLLNDVVIKKWVKECLSSDACNDSTPVRASIYILPVDVTETAIDDAMRVTRNNFMHSLAQELIKAGFDIKKAAHEKQAQYTLQLVQSQYARAAEIGTMSFTVEVKDRADNALIGVADDTSTGSILTTEPAMKKSLLQRAAIRVTAEVQRLIVEQGAIEIQWYATKELPLHETKAQLENELAAVVGISKYNPQAMNAFRTAINLRVTEESQHNIYETRIPQKYRLPTRSMLESTLLGIQAIILQSKDGRLVVGKAGRKLSLYDNAACPPQFCSSKQVAWEAGIESLFRAGKLDSPMGVGNNVIDSLRQQAQTTPGDKRIELLALRVSTVFLDKFEEALLKKQNGLAQRYIDRAEKSLDTLGVKQKENIAKARAKLADLSKPPTTSESIPVPVVQSPPVIVIPELEARLRAFAPVQVSALTGLAADLDGIRSVQVNRRKVKTSAASAGQMKYISLPNAEVIQFPIMSQAEGTLTIQVEDYTGLVAKREIVVNNGNASVTADDASQDGREVLDEGQYWALLIANQNYTRGVPKLETPHNDVKRLKEVLLEHYRFDQAKVIVVKDATKAQMVTALYKIVDSLRANDSLIIYYAGHGYQDLGFAGLGFWMPVDAISPESESIAEARATWLPNSQVHDILLGSRSKHVLLISDSCYSGTFKTRGLSRVKYVANMDFLYGLAGKKSRRAITSGDLEPVADGGGNGNSIFAYHLIRFLRQNHQAINAEHVYHQVRKALQGAAQTPQYFPLKDAGDDGGDFVFVPRS